MDGHLTLSPLAAHLCGTALARAMDRRELDETPVERSQAETLAAVLAAVGAAGLTRVVITIGDPVERVASEYRAREVVLGGAGVR